MPKELFDKKPKAVTKKNEIPDEGIPDEVLGSRRPRRSAANAAIAMVRNLDDENQDEDQNMVFKYFDQNMVFKYFNQNFCI